VDLPSRLIPIVGLLLATAACGAPAEDDADEAGAELGTTTLTLRTDFERNAIASAAPGTSDADKERAAFHLGNAYWLARLADYAYWEPATIQQQLRNLRVETREFRFFSNTCTGAQAYYIATPQGSVLAFRGSNALADDWIHTNGNSFKVSWSGPGLVHAGFRRQFESLWMGEPCREGSEGGALGAFIGFRHGWESEGVRRGNALYVVGHSLGGALATLFLGRVQADACQGMGKAAEKSCDRPPSVPVSALYTYASPKVGNGTFATTVAERARNRTPIFRIVHSDDPVTLLPRNFVPELTDYRHVGYSGWLGESSFQVWIKKDTLRVSEPVVRGIAFQDHGLLTYIDTLRDLARARSQL
jgi:hypothetical protein